MARSIPPRSSSYDGEDTNAILASNQDGAEGPQVREERQPAARNQNARQGALFRVQEVDGERAARFHLFQDGFGALTDGQVDVLTERIESYGGVLTEVKEDADTIVVQFAGVDELRRKYWFSKTIYVVEAAFVNICINSGRYKENLPRPERKGMGGQPVGSVRVPFTREDDQHLAEYLAAVIPDEGEGGRGGIEVYRRLVEAGMQFEEFRWAQRHPMWSWRERYSKHKDHFNPLIQQLVKANPPRPDGKGLYERSRYFIRGRQFGGAGEEEDEEEEGWEAAPQEQAANQQRAPEEAPDKHPRRQHQSEPGPPRRADDNMQLPPRKRARYTAPIRRMSSVEQMRGARRARDSSSPESNEDEEPWEASSAEEDVDVDLDALFANDAGPSGFQQSAKPLSSSRLQTSPQAQMQKGKAPVKPASRNTQQRQAARPNPSQVPMSSQATLVAPSQGQRRHRNPPPSTLGGPTQVAQEEEEEEESEDEDIPPTAGPSNTRQRPAPQRNAIVKEEGWPQEPERRRVPVPQTKRPAAPPDRAGQTKRIGIISMPPPPGLFPHAKTPQLNSNSRHEARNDVPVAGPSRPRQASRNLLNQVGPSPNSAVRINEGRSPANARTQEGDEDDRHVEELLELSHGTSIVASAASASKHAFEEEAEFDSDDERMVQNLVPSPALNRTNASTSSRHLGQQRPVNDANSPASTRRASGVQQQPSSAGRTPSKPLSAVLVPPGALDRTISIGSETDPNMPMPGTRARQERTRMRERLRQTPYTPPSGTRAAQLAESLQLRSRQVSRPALLNSRR